MVTYVCATEEDVYRVASPQINNLTLQVLPSPLLLSPSPPAEDKLCNAATSRSLCHRELCQCLHLHHIPLHEVVDLVLIDGGSERP